MKSQRPRTLRVVSAIGWVTFTDVIRDKILYNVILVACFLFGVGFLASRLSYLRPERVLLDLGLSALALSCGAIAVLIGSSLVGRDFERRTVYVTLSHPISRLQFIIGKFTGVSLVIFVNWLLLGAIYVGMLLAMDARSLLNSTFFTAVILVLLQSLSLASIAILFSAFSTTSLSVMLTAGLYMVGSNNSEMRMLASKMQSMPARWFLEGCAAALPNFENFNLGMKLTYDIPVSGAFAGHAIFYAFLLICVSVLGAGALIRGREV